MSEAWPVNHFVHISNTSSGHSNVLRLNRIAMSFGKITMRAFDATSSLLAWIRNTALIIVSLMPLISERLKIVNVF